MRFEIRLDMSNQYTGDEKYTDAWFKATKKYINEKFARDGVIFLKEALIIFGFSTMEFSPGILSRRWVYKDKRNKIRVRLRHLTINDGSGNRYRIPTIEFITKPKKGYTLHALNNKETIEYV